MLYVKCCKAIFYSVFSTADQNHLENHFDAALNCNNVNAIIGIATAYFTAKTAALAQLCF